MKAPFDPKGGAFAANIRATIGADDTELRQSLEKFGWVKQFPAFQDELGVVLVGHRRLKLAKELGITPIVETIRFGAGDAADAERVKLALASNLGAAPLTKEDRKHIAEHLYGKREWTMEAIADALGVSHPTIVRDLEKFVQPEQIKSRAKTATNPKGAGRPKGSKKPAVPPRAARPSTVEREEKIAVLAEAGLSAKEIGHEVGLGERAVHQALEHEKIRREARADPKIDPSTLSLSSQEKLAAALRQQQRKQEAEFEHTVRERLQQLLEESGVLAQYKKEIDEAREIMTSRKGIMKLADYNLIRRCLHPDNSASADVRNRAFVLFEKFKLRLVAEDEAPTMSPPLPRTYAEMLKAREAVRAKRRAQRGGASAVAPKR